MTKYFLSTTGADTNNGTSSTTAFGSLWKATSVMVAGDELEVSGGYYPNTGTGLLSGLIGSPTQVTRIYATKGEPVFQTKIDGGGLNIFNCAYVSVEGLTFLGNNALLSYDEAYANKDTYVGKFSASGIDVRNTYRVLVKQNTIRDFSGGGILFIGCDYVSVNNNVVNGCTKYSPYGTQGISMLGGINSPGCVAGEERFIAQYNHVYDCINYIPWSTALGGNGVINEGAGIYNDTTLETNGVRHTGKARFSENVCSFNGGSGIHVLSAVPTLIRGNFCNGNNRSFTDRGEISIMYAPDSQVIGNQCGTDADLAWLRVYGSANTKIQNNVVRGTNVSSILSSPGYTFTGTSYL